MFHALWLEVCLNARTIAGGDKSGPSDGDTDDIGGVWMSLPGDTAHEVNALSSAPDTDVLYDASNTLSITLGVAPRVRSLLFSAGLL